MRRIVLALAGTVSGLILMFSYHTSLGAGSPVAVAPVGAGTTTTTGRNGATTGGTASRSAGSGSSTATTVTGDTAQTQWGPVQVRIRVAGGSITAVDAVRYPNGNGRDQEINSYALPVLAQEALAAQSANIDHVSGATVTSNGYVASLQSAIDKANL